MGSNKEARERKDREAAREDGRQERREEIVAWLLDWLGDGSSCVGKDVIG